jgi:phosphate uptake regulator/aminoglycoside phosphotransferase (APT) family kinase protein
MRIPRSIHDNLRFLTAEVSSQVANLQSYFETGSATIAHRILDRSGYAYNLKTRIHNSCFGRIAQSKRSNADQLSLRVLESIATDLDRITELCRDCVHQMGYLRDRRTLRPGAYLPLLKRVGKGIDLIESAARHDDSRMALKIGRVEQKLDLAYRGLQKRYTKELKGKKRTEDLVSALFVAHYVEQMGDTLLNISEAIISANPGQPVDMGRYHSLKASVEQLSSAEKLSDLVVEPIAETRSGSAISGISSAAREEDGYVAIFKDGQKRKVKEERQGVESWHEIYPGLAPKILSYHKRGQSAAMLIEHLAGLTFEQIVLNEPPPLIEETLEQLGRTLRSVWKATRRKKPVAACYMEQTAKRLGDVYAIHPEFQQGDSRICGLAVPAFDTLLQRARRFEERIKTPFSVYIHGDFNVDNIIYDPLEKKINFIDLHRSRYLDYVQDVSVFMVSNYRLQILDAPLRRRILQVAQEFCDFARRFARKAGDDTFELRLALGLARSFATSTRFILDKSLAQAMFLRARYLIELVLASDPKRADRFHVPVEEIFVG